MDLASPDKTTSDTLFTESLWYNTDGWQTFAPNWSEWASNGIVDGLFHAGVDFGASAHSSVIPALGADTTSAYVDGFSWVRSPEGGWLPAHQAGPAWNFMIRASVTLLPSGQQVTLHPVAQRAPAIQEIPLPRATPGSVQLQIYRR